MKRPNYRFVTLFVVLSVAILGEVGAETPDVPAQYQTYFEVYRDNRNTFEKIMAEVGLPSSNVGQAIAVIGGIHAYKKLPTLGPAEIDVRRLVEHLDKVQNFDQIIVLQNDEFNADNLDYFLTQYVPQELSNRPGSRFLFAYSGHGITTDQGKGYILKHDANDAKDRFRAFSMQRIRSLLDSSIDEAHQSLVLINSCFSGTFLKQSFSIDPVVPMHPGAHAILASSAGELSWSDPAYGGTGGSIFFEALVRGIASGSADTSSFRQPYNSGDGIVTFSEIAHFLDTEIKGFTNQKQNPVSGPLVVNDRNGGFFFLRKDRQALTKPDQFNPDGQPFGGESNTSRVIQVNSDVTRYVILNAPAFNPGDKVKVKISANSSNVRARAVFSSSIGPIESVDAKFVISEGGIVIPWKIPSDSPSGRYTARIFVQELGSTKEEISEISFDVNE